MLSDEQWEGVDAFIYANQGINAIQSYLSLTDSGLNAAAEAIHQRRNNLVARFPERFKGREQYRAEALESLEQIRSKIAAIESARDGDDWCSYVSLYAIVEEPSTRHPKYSRHTLCDMTCVGLKEEQALALGGEIAEFIQVPLYRAWASYGEYETGDYGPLFSSQEEVDRWWCEWVP